MVEVFIVRYMQNTVVCCFRKLEALLSATYSKCDLFALKEFQNHFFFKGFSVINGSLAFTNCMQPDLRTRKISILKYYAMMSTKFDFGSIARVS